MQPTEFEVKRRKVMLSPLHPHLGVCEMHNDASAKANVRTQLQYLYDIEALTCSNCYSRLFETKDEEVRTWNAHCNNSTYQKIHRLPEIENRTVNPPSNSVPYCTSASQKEFLISWHSKLPRLSNDKRGKVVGRSSWNETAHVNLAAWLFRKNLVAAMSFVQDVSLCHM